MKLFFLLSLISLSYSSISALDCPCTGNSKVPLTFLGDALCDATIVNAEYLMTPASCVDENKANGHIALVGSQKKRFDSIKITVFGDVAFVKLFDKIPFGEVQPACLSENTDKIEQIVGKGNFCKSQQIFNES